MGVIKALSESVISKIAAGEVVERPASVVKELLENSLDADATKIEIDLADAGKKLIRVSDNGRGIPREDLQLAVSRYATSKLSTADDLFTVSTLGFRGEALASIAAVSQLRLGSRPAGSLEGAEVEVSGGKVGEVKACGMPEGTAVEVSNLFFNVPVRRKFLRFAKTELSHALDTIHRFTLSFPAVHFTVTHNGRSVLNLPPGRTVRDRAQAVFGAELADSLLELPGSDESFSVTGFITPASFTRPNSRLQYFFLNRRYVRDRALAHAVSEAYRGLIPQGRYAAYFLFVRIDPEEVDVNVHPTKIEVRFRRQARVHDAVLDAVRTRLSPGAPSRISVSPSAEEIADELIRKISPKPEQRSMAPAPGPPSSPAAPPAAAPRASEAGRPVFQVLDSYLVSEGVGGLVIVDQHALHERVIFEELKEQLTSSRLPIQSFLIPEPMELLEEDVQRLEAARKTLEGLGVKFESVSRKTVVVRAVPQLVARANPRELLEGILERLSENPSTRLDSHALVEEILQGLACKAAVEAGEKLTAEEMSSLLMRANETRFQATCPQGRPTTLILGKEQLEKHFKRT